jgi:hypothetical protein
MKHKKGALEISFGWLFALIAGAVILFLAIYFSTRLIGTEKEIVSAKTGEEIGILLNPLETGFESAQTTSITIPAETRIHNTCDDFSELFGRQKIQLEQKSFSKWTKTDVDVSFNNKYIFSEKEIEGKKFYIFSKPFSFPFKIADLIYMSSADDIYCFVNAPEDIGAEITELNQSNLLTGNCPEGSIKICFGNSDCSVNVDLNLERVEKNGEEMYFTETEEGLSLMYAAIFSNSETYECQLKRLMTRVKELALIYHDKESITGKRGCNSELGSDLVELSELADAFSSSEEIGIIKIKTDIIAEKNNGECMLW